MLALQDREPKFNPTDPCKKVGHSETHWSFQQERTHNEERLVKSSLSIKTANHPYPPPSN